MKKKSENGIGFRMRDYHTKTELAFAYKCKVFNPETEEIEERVFDFDKKLKAEKAPSIISKKFNVSVLEVISVDVSKTLYGVTNEVWEQNKINLSKLMKGGNN